MKKIMILVLLLASFSVMAQPHFTANLIVNGTYLSIHIDDDHLVPPFEAGDLWKIINSQEQRKIIKEKELVMDCDAFKNQTNDTVGKCSLLFPYKLFQKIGDKMVFKAEGEVAARLNRYFVDSAYISMQRNGAYLSSYNTRRQFFFGINESLIQK